MTITKDTTYTLIVSLLKKYNYNIYKDDWEKEVQRMGFSPSLPMFSIILKVFGVDNFVAKVPQQLFNKVPLCFIGIFVIQSRQTTVFVDRKKDIVKITDFQTGKKYVVSILKAAKMWTGYIISINEKEKNIAPPVERASKENDKIIGYTVAYLALAVLAYLYISCCISLRSIGLIVTASAGLIISYFSLQTSLGFYNQRLQEVCHLIKQGDCFIVIHSTGSKVLYFFSLADISFLYMVYSLLTAIFAINNMRILQGNLLLMPIAIFFVIYSVIYQSFVIKKYCIICLITAVCVLLHATVLYSYLPIKMEIYSYVLNILFGLVAISITLVTKIVLKKFIFMHADIAYKNQIYYNSTVLDHFFSHLDKIKIEDINQLPLIPLWGDGKTVIVMIISLSCSYCKETYKYIHKLKYYWGEKIQVKMLIDCKRLDKELEDVFLKLIDMQNNYNLEKACDDIFVHGMSIKRWKKKWGKPNSQSYELLQSKIRYIERFEDKNHIDDAPMLIIDGRIWPTFYSYSDLIHCMQYMQ
ncbi:MAG: vitamin K epoxide reductase family protein [Bacteroidaceae bacterium]